MSMKTRTVLPATLDAVDRLCGELRGGLFASLPCAERFPVELLLREALTNAVVHGLKGGPQGEVHCEIECFSGGVTIHVCDTGEGFDWRPRLDAPKVGTLSESGRGIEIMRRYSSGLPFQLKWQLCASDASIQGRKRRRWLNLK